MTTEPLSFGDALVALGFDRGWVTYGTHQIVWPEGEPANAPTLEQVQAKFVELGGTLIPPPEEDTPE